MQKAKANSGRESVKIANSWRLNDSCGSNNQSTYTKISCDLRNYALLGTCSLFFRLPDVKV